MPEERPGLVDRLADLEVIGRVEGVAEGGRVDGFEDLEHPGGGVAVDPLLVLEEQGHAPLGGDLGLLGHPAEDLVAVLRGVVACGDVVAEDPDPRGMS